MFKLTLHDRKGIELKEGDIVAISNSSGWREGRYFNFYAEVKWSPFNKCWQRQITNNAIFSMELLFKIKF